MIKRRLKKQRQITLMMTVTFLSDYLENIHNNIFSFFAESYQSEESDKSLEAEEIAKQKEKEDKIAAAAAAALKPTQTTTSFKPNETTTSLKLNPPS